MNINFLMLLNFSFDEDAIEKKFLLKNYVRLILRKLCGEFGFRFH